MNRVLKRCPLCGNEAKHTQKSFARHEISCSRCNLRLHAFMEEAAFSAWNRRPVTPLQQNTPSTELDVKLTSIA